MVSSEHRERDYSTMSICKLFLVSGRGQGVWYRAATQQKTLTLGTTGHAKNLPDGRVEVLAYGAEITWLNWNSGSDRGHRTPKPMMLMLMLMLMLVE